MKKPRFWVILIPFVLILFACSTTPSSDLEVVRAPLPPTAAEDAARLRATALQMRELVELTAEYRQVLAPNTVTHPHIPVGGSQIFWYEDQANEVEVQTTAYLVAQSAGLNMWVEEGVEVDPAVIQKAMKTLEEKIIPTNRTLFGVESQPGIDEDDRLNILHVAEMGGGVVGYFSSADGYASEVNPFSNGRDMFYINLEFVEIGEEDYYDVVAHEYQHMIHWHVDRSEMSWLNEGLSELAAAVNGYGDSDHLDTFVAEPDTPLTYFDYEGGDYGSAYLFSRYLYERFGSDFIFHLVQEPLDSASGIEAVLTRFGHPLTFDQLFADWVVAGYAASADLTPLDPQEKRMLEQVTFPEQFAFERLRGGDVRREEVNQFGTDFWRITGRRPQTVSFTGSTQVPLMASGPSHGNVMWSAIPGDDSTRTLTRRFDVNGVAEATLQFSIWYEIETGWDFAYVAVSKDGRSWTTLQTTATTTANPRGTNLGNGFTGISGSGLVPTWTEQTADLTPFLGGAELYIRFLYVTDDAIFDQGVSVDHIRIPELNYADSAEDSAGGWEANGFVRHSNILPQTYIAQLILINRDDRFTVTPLPITADQTGLWEIPLDDQWREAIIALSGTAHTTIHPSVYELQVGR